MLWLLLAGLLHGPAARPQAAPPLRFRPVCAGRPLQLQEGVAGGDSIRISVLRFYISKLQLLRGGEPAWADPQPARLLDAARPETCAIPLPSGVRYDSVRFLLGIDSTTNAAGAAGGDLDPVLGMYWAWQSGYINIKLEGTSARCNTRKHEFQFHLGGFRRGTGCAEWIALPLASGVPPEVWVDAAVFLKRVALDAQPQVMAPGPEAVSLSHQAAAMFRTTPTP